jgi:hypothetical protein
MMFSAGQSNLFKVLFLTLSLLGCAPHMLYHSDMSLCQSASPEAQCKKSALQKYINPAEPEKEYFLGFIEFDDQGQLFNRNQMRVVLDELNKEAGKNDLLMVVFVHGWKHSASPEDGNIETFRASLKHLSELETRISQLTGTQARHVTGIYIGWRGGSVTVPLLKELTFWDRKSTAHKVGFGGVNEALNRIVLVKRTNDSKAATGSSRTRLVVVGHSFGGAIVYSALAHALETGFVHTKGPDGMISDTRGFGDLVVLINPAFEALRYSTLSDMSTERGTYFASQLPVLAILTSEADNATKTAFPMGRWFSTMFEKEREVTRKNGRTRKEEKIDQADANVTAVGHFAPYRTHRLTAQSPVPENSETQSIESAVKAFFDVSESWENDETGSTITFEGSILERTLTSAGRNPYMVIQVDENLIRDHNDISDPRIASFVRQLILISSQSIDPVERQMTRHKFLSQ